MVVGESIEFKQALLRDQIVLKHFTTLSYKNHVQGDLGGQLHQFHFSGLPSLLKLFFENLKFYDVLDAHDWGIFLRLFQNDPRHVEKLVVCLNDPFVFAHCVVFESQQLQNIFSLRSGGVTVAKVVEVFQVTLDLVLHGLLHFLDSRRTVFVFRNLEFGRHVLFDRFWHFDGLENQVFAEGVY